MDSSTIIDRAFAKYGKRIDMIPLPKLQREFGNVFNIKNDYDTLELTRCSTIDAIMEPMLSNGPYYFPVLSKNFQLVLVKYFNLFGLQPFYNRPYPQEFLDAILE